MPGHPRSTRYRQQISLGFPLEHADESLVLGIQAALWFSGRVREAGSIDILIAGYAIAANDATVLSADRDFDHIAVVTNLSHEYIAPSP